MKLNSNIPSGPIEKKWSTHRFEMKLINPSNRRKYSIIVVGTGLAGASAAASLGELGYNVTFVFVSRISAPRAQHCRAGRHQRAEKLCE